MERIWLKHYPAGVPKEIDPAQYTSLVALLEESFAKFRDRKAFVFVHSYDVHSDYASLPEHEKVFVGPYDGVADGTTAQMLAFREGKIRLSAADAPHLRDLYDAGIRQMDAELRRFFDALAAERLLDGAWVVVTSDHGEEFFEHAAAAGLCDVARPAVIAVSATAAARMPTTRAPRRCTPPSSRRRGRAWPGGPSRRAPFR